VLSDLGVGLGTTLQVAEEEAGEVSMHTLLTADKLVREGKSGDEPSLLHPEDGRKGAGEEDALDSHRCHQMLSECRLIHLRATPPCACCKELSRWRRRHTRARV